MDAFYFEACYTPKFSLGFEILIFIFVQIN